MKYCRERKDGRNRGRERKEEGIDSRTSSYGGASPACGIPSLNPEFLSVVMEIATPQRGEGLNPACSRPSGNTAFLLSSPRMALGKQH